MTLTFPPRPSPPRPRKRGRAATDIDGEHSCLFKKKRRLRLFLITSRLSPQFSHPATNIVDRGSSKIAIWAKQRSLGRNLLRKAAILNRIRRQTIGAKEKEEDLGEISVHREQEQKQLELASLALLYGSHDTHTRPLLKDASEFPPSCAVDTEDPLEISEASPLITPPPITPDIVVSDEHKDETLEYRSPNDAYSYSPPKAQLPRRTYLPLPPSPLGLSNYDALDLEDDYDHYAHFDDDEEEEDDMADSRSTSANTTVSYTSTLSTAATGTSEAVKSPQQMTFCDFNDLDHDEPVMGDYDQVDEGAEAIWPNPFAEETTPKPLLPASSSPNFLVLFASSPTESVGPFSPNFAAALPEMQEQEHWEGQAYGPRGMLRTEEHTDTKQERDRQRNFMFLRFNS